MDKLIPAVGYVRVSSDEQVEGFSLEAQEEKIKAFAISQDYHLVEIYCDEGYSAKDLSRPGIKKLIEDAKKGKFRIILVYRLDRLTRRLKDLNELIEVFEKHNIRFQSITEPFETKTAAGRLMINVFGGFAQFERELISERTQIGLQKRFEQGKWITSAPFGYTMKNCSLSINSKETEIVRKIYRMYLEFGFGLIELARKLNNSGYRTRNNVKWRKSSLYKILTNKVYLGYTVWSGQIRKGEHEAIIDKFTFDAVQQKLRENCNCPPRQVSSTHFLTGLIKCAKCGARMFVTRPGGKKKKYRYYICANHQLDKSCDQIYINAQKLEAKITDTITQISENPDLIQKQVSRFKKGYLVERSDLKKEIGQVLNRIEGISNQQERLNEWLSRTLPGKITTDLIGRKLELLEQKKQELQKKLLYLEGHKGSFDLKEITAEKISGNIKRFNFFVDGLKKSQRKIIFETIIKNISIKSKNHIDLSLRLPLVPLFPQNLSGSQLTQYWLRVQDSNLQPFG